MTLRKVDDERAVYDHELIGHDNEPSVGLAGKRGQRGFHLGGGVDRDRLQLDRKIRRRGFDVAQEIRTAEDRYLRVEQDRDLTDPRHDLLEELEPFGAHGRLDIGEASHVSARPREALSKLLADWIRRRNEHDWDRAGLDEERSNGRRGSG